MSDFRFDIGIYVKDENYNHIYSKAFKVTGQEEERLARLRNAEEGFKLINFGTFFGNQDKIISEMRSIMTMHLFGEKVDD